MDLSIDTSAPMRSPATIATATAVALDYYGPTGIRRAAPVTVALDTTALQAFARGDHTWDIGFHQRAACGLLVGVIGQPPVGRLPGCMQPHGPAWRTTDQSVSTYPCPLLWRRPSLRAR